MTTNGPAMTRADAYCLPAMRESVINESEEAVDRSTKAVARAAGARRGRLPAELTDAKQGEMLRALGEYQPTPVTEYDVICNAEPKQRINQLRLLLEEAAWRHMRAHGKCVANCPAEGTPDYGPHRAKSSTDTNGQR